MYSMKNLCNKISAEKVVMEEWRVDMNRVMCGLLVFLTRLRNSCFSEKSWSIFMLVAKDAQHCEKVPMV